MTDNTELTIQILRQIRDEIVTTRTDLNGRIDHMRTELSGRIDETNTRVEQVEHALLDLAEQQRFVVRHLQALTTRDRRLEDEVGELRGRLEVVEKKVGVT